MTTTRERLERRWTPGRVVLLIAGIVVTLLVVAAGLALWWLPPVLAETPRERFAAPTRVTVQDAWGSAGVEVAPGWVPLGVGPFLPADRVTLLSPDGVYRAELGLASLPDAGPAAVEDALAALLATHDLAGVAGAAGAAGAGSGLNESAGDPAGAADAPPAAASDRGESAGRLRWSEETLTSGATVRYTDLERGDTTYTVAIVLLPTGALPAASPAAAATPAAGIPGEATSAGASEPTGNGLDDATGTNPSATPVTPPVAAPPILGLSLVAAVPTADAAAYRTVTADLIASAAFARATTSPSPSALPSGGDR